MTALLVTNDSTVFLSEDGNAGDIFGGRFTEVRRLRERLDDVTFAVISGGYGVVTEDERISRYAGVTDSKRGYEELQARTGFAQRIAAMASEHDVTILAVPKDMMRILIHHIRSENVIAVTSDEFRPMFKKMGWHHLTRRGARIGKTNAEAIIALLASFSL